MNMAVLGCSIGEGAIIIVLRYYVIMQHGLRHSYYRTVVHNPNANDR